MKKIMKKVLSWVLVFVMVVSLSPMTAKASTYAGTASDPNPVTDGSAEFTIGGGNRYYCQYLAPAPGEYTLTIETESDNVNYFCAYIDDGSGYYPTSAWSDEDGDSNDKKLVTTVAATRQAGCIISFFISNSSLYNVDYTVSITEGAANVGGSGEANGTSSNPYALEVGTTQTATTTGEWDMVYYEYEVTEDGTFTFTVDDSVGNWMYTVLKNNYPVTMYDTMYGCDGDNTSTTVDVTVGDVLLVGLNYGTYYGYTVAQVPFTTSFEADAETIYAGTTSDPNPVTDGTAVFTIGGGNRYYCQYLAPAPGEYTLTIETENDNVNYFCAYIDDGSGYYPTSAWSDEDGDSNDKKLVTTVAATRQSGCVISFFISNSTLYDVEYTVTITEGAADNGGTEEADGTSSNPYALEVGTTQVATTTGEWDMVYYKYEVTEGGTFTFTVDDSVGNWMYTVLKNNYPVTMYDTMYGCDGDNTSTTVDVTVGDVLLVGLNYGTYYGYTVAQVPFTTSLETNSAGEGGGAGSEGDQGGSTEDVTGSGSEEDPYSMIMGENVVVLDEIDAYVYYAYTAEEQGALYINMSSENESWFYSGYVNNSETIDQFINPNKTWTTTDNQSTDAEPVSLKTVFLEAGDTVVLRVSTARNSNWERPEGTVVFNAYFAAGVVNEDIEDTKVEYVVSDTMLALGTNVVTLDASAYTTIYEFCPDEAGLYAFETDNGLLGYWGGGTFFVSDQTEDKTTTLEYNLENAGPSIMVGVTGEGTVTITIEKAGEAIVTPTIPKVEYVNIITPVEYDFAEIEDGAYGLGYEWVDVQDEIKDEAVMDENGVYHLNSVDGPVLFVCLDDPVMSLMMAWIYGQVIGHTSVDGEIVQIDDYNNAFYEYYAVSEMGFYPLTIDLVTIFKEVGANQGWYANGSILEKYMNGETEDTDPNYLPLAYPEEEAWMYACYYVTGVNSIEAPFEYEAPDKDDTEDEGTGNEGAGNEGTGNEGTGNEGTGNEGTGNEGTGNEGTGNEGTNNEGSADKAPETGDAANTVLWITILGLGVVAVLSSAFMRKRIF